jgi:hypothetical protein
MYSFVSSFMLNENVIINFCENIYSSFVYSFNLISVSNDWSQYSFSNSKKKFINDCILPCFIIDKQFIYSDSLNPFILLISK